MQSIRKSCGFCLENTSSIWTLFTTSTAMPLLWDTVLCHLDCCNVPLRSPCCYPYPQRFNGSTAARVTILRNRAELAIHLLETLQWLSSHRGVKARKVRQMEHSPICLWLEALPPFPHSFCLLAIPKCDCTLVLALCSLPEMLPHSVKS